MLEGDPQYLIRVMPAKGNHLAGLFVCRERQPPAVTALNLWPSRGASTQHG